MDWVPALSPGCEKGYNACLVIVDRYSKNTIFLPSHKDDTAMDKDLSICNRLICHTELFKNIIIDRDQRFTSALWKTLHKLLGTKLSFSTAYNPQTDELEERMIQNLEDMIRRSCAYGLELKAPDCLQALRYILHTQIGHNYIKKYILNYAQLISHSYIQNLSFLISERMNNILLSKQIHGFKARFGFYTNLHLG
ncbi:hypothetical protein O181_001372 [Austropuccinia psidii MF-1]|uniref:Integrase catalytic domain-containing protein n=1 Tax=Austropuccinia psidii MF-1 TaxID=1389203 RepID=A0A9Q3BAN9_9BASI|nr:hypothetical protein [Austropuccinia psidii MF-1]